MKYLIKQKYMSFKDKYAIKDEDGNEVYQVAGQLISFGRKIRIYDLQGNEIYFLDQRPFSFFGKVEIKVGEEVVGTFKGKFSPFSHKYVVEIPGQNWNYKVKSIVGFNFKVTDLNSESKEPVAKISKKLMKIADTYCVETLNDSMSPDVAIIIGLCVDMFVHGDHH